MVDIVMRYLFSLPLIISLLAGPAWAAKAKHVDVKPKEGGAGISIVNLGKARSYYPLSSRRSATIEVKGPGDLRILTRARFGPNAADELDYRIIYKTDGAEKLTFDVEGVTRSEDAKYKDATLGKPGDSKDLTMKIGRGYHSIEFILADSLPNVSARFL